MLPRQNEGGSRGHRARLFPDLSHFSTATDKRRQGSTYLFKTETSWEGEYRNKSASKWKKQLTCSEVRCLAPAERGATRLPVHEPAHPLRWQRGRFDEVVAASSGREAWGWRGRAAP